MDPYQIGFIPFAQGEEQGQVVLGIGLALLGGFFAPTEGLAHVRGLTATFFEHHCQIELGFAVALLGPHHHQDQLAKWVRTSPHRAGDQGPITSCDQALSQPKQTHRQGECGHPPVKGEAARAMPQHMGQTPAAKPM